MACGVVGIPAPHKEFPRSHHHLLSAQQGQYPGPVQHHSTSPVSPSASRRKDGTPLPHELLYSMPWTTQRWIKGIQPNLPNKRDTEE